MSLEPIDPAHALELCLADRENTVADATLYSHRLLFGHLVRWCENEGIEECFLVCARAHREIEVYADVNKHN